jgi:hypothetical protein
MLRFRNGSVFRLLHEAKVLLKRRDVVNPAYSYSDDTDTSSSTENVENRRSTPRHS